MMVFDWLLVVAPVAFSALVFGLALGTEPIDLSLYEVTSPNSLVERGFSPDTIDDLLEQKIVAIVQTAGSDRATGEIDIGTVDTAINAYAEIVGVEAPVRATQRLLDMVGYIAETHFLIAGNQNVLASLHIRDSNSLKTAQYKEYNYPPENFDGMLDAISSDIVAFLDPYILSVYLYQNAIEQKQNGQFGEVIDHARRFIPIVDPSVVPWFYGLMGHVAERVDDPELAIAYNKEALTLDSKFYLAHINLGRVLLSQGKPLEAVEQLLAALRIDSTVASAYLLMAQAMFELQHYNEASAALARAGQLAPEFAEVYETRANVYEQLGLPLQARQQRALAKVARERQPLQNHYDTL